jgi:prepilin-type N-terminal cleavage/methylation domain-containing protein
LDLRHLTPPLSPSGAEREKTPVTPHVSRFTLHVSRFTFHASGFTLIELLVVISILGILAALTMPALKNFAKSDATISASRQLLDDVGRARQLAISQHTTVYMVFVPTNFWADATGNFNTPWFNSLTPAQQTAVTNLCDKQLTGYTFMAYGATGDQPGNHQWHYLAPWQDLPDGAFIASIKFTTSPDGPPNTITDESYPIYGFHVTNNIPFPTEINTTASFPPPCPLPYLPYIAFNYLGQLVSEVDTSGNYRDAYIPLAKGSISLARDVATKALLFNPPDVMEIPPGNSTNSSYNIVHIDKVTGRAVLEFQKIK